MAGGVAVGVAAKEPFVAGANLVAGVIVVVDREKNPRGCSIYLYDYSYGFCKTTKGRH